MSKVILIGYMGSGKSVIGKKLAVLIGVDFRDLDDLIEKKMELPVEKIFSSKGELYFRKLEQELFLELLQTKNNLIISTGGGTPCYFNNHELLNSQNVVSIYLKASIDTLFNRLINDKQKRPLIASLDDSEIKEYIAKHLFERNYYYNQATYIVDVDGKNTLQILSEIKTLVT
jgi:shikimate kinase